MSTCKTCQPLDCRALVDSDDLYSLDRILFPFVLNCPSGQNCDDVTTITLLCCEQTIVVTFPPGASVSRKRQLLQEGVNKCALAEGFCGNDFRDDDDDSGLTPPPLPPILYRSRAQTVVLECGTGGEFHYFLKSGAFGLMFARTVAPAVAQAAVDRLAFDFAQQEARENQFCVLVPKMCPCLSEEADIALRISGGNAPFDAQSVSGYMPDGMSFLTDGFNVSVIGTPETPGLYQSTLNVTDGIGSFWVGPMEMNVIAIGYGSVLADDFVVPAVSATVAIELDETENVEVGNVFRVAVLNGNGAVIQEIGTFEVTALDTPSPGETTIENLTATEGVTVPDGAMVYWELEDTPEFEVGTPYQFQMPAVGGSGAYRWKIASGTLPTGLTLSTTGLISGTPSVSSTFNVTLEVIDLNCIEDEGTLYEPTVDLITTSETTVATVRGFGEFSGFTSTPPKRYMIRTWTGAIAGNDASGRPALPDEGLSVALVNVDAFPFIAIAVSHFIIEGADEINLQGQQIATHTAQLYSSCAGPNNVLPQALYNGGQVDPEFNGTFTLPGWAYPYDISLSYPNLPVGTVPKCLSPAFPLVPDTTLTDPEDMYHGLLIPQGSTVASNTTSFTTPYIPDATQPPTITPPHLGSPTLNWGQLNFYYKHNYSVVLSEEYTDAMALANASVTEGTSPIAQNLPRTVGFVSRFTTVTYELECHNLIQGQDYTVRVTLENSGGTSTEAEFNFIADGETHTITDTIPTPDAGTSTIVKDARIEFTVPEE